MKTYQWVLNLIDKASGPMQGILTRAERTAQRMGNLDKASRACMVGLNQTAEVVERVRDRLTEAIAPGADFEQKVADLSALTGKTGKDLDSMANSARNLALQFGGDAGQYVESYKSILGELGPAIADKPKALQSMGTAVAILSKTMGGDAKGAQEALTTGLQQFGGALETPEQKAAEMTRQMNMMAAAAKEGSAEVPHIAATMKVAGAAASSANIGFKEFNAATQVLAANTIKGAEAGTGLRNVIAKMGEGRFLPKDVQDELKAAGVNIDRLGNKSLTFRDRLTELKKIQGDSALMAKLFGTENANAGMALVKGTDMMKGFEDAIIGVPAAQTMAATSMDTFQGRMDRMGAAWKDLGISVFQSTKEYLPAVQGVANAGAVYQQALKPALETTGNLGQRLWKMAFFAKEGEKSLARTGLEVVKAGAKYLWTGAVGVAGYLSSLITATAAQWGLNVAMNANPIGVIIIGLLAVGTAVYLIIKHWDTVKVWLAGLAQFMLKMNPFYWLVKGAFALFPGLEKWFKGLWDKITGFFQSLMGKIKWLWDKIAPYLGFGEMKITAPDISSNLIQPDSPLDPTGAGGLGAGAVPGSKGVKQKMDKVSAGGSKPTTVNITVQKFQDKIEVHATTVKEGVNDIVAQLEEGLMRVVNGVSQGVGV